MPISINLRAALFMVIAMAGFTTNDAVTRLIMGAALFLGKRVRWRRWMAIAVGFVGAALIVASGLYALDRERRAGQGRPAAGSTGPAMAPDGL